MSRKPYDVACPECGSNRLRFPPSDDGPVRCEECGDASQSLRDVKARVSSEMFELPEQDRSPEARAGGRRTKMRDRHMSEVDASQAEVRESIAETDRLVVESDRMLRRHRRECDEDDRG